MTPTNQPSQPLLFADRTAIFSRYNYVNTKWHKWRPHPDLLAAVPAKRQTLFRPVHVEGNLVDSV